MPELPEVETTKNAILPYLNGLKIVKVIVRRSHLRFEIPKVIQHISNQNVLSVSRRAKYILIELEIGFIVIHLGMSGHLRLYFPPFPETEKHDHIDVILQNNVLLRYSDPRRFGSWTFCESLNEHFLLKNLGIEPLSKDFNANFLYKVSRNKKVMIKNLIMNNQIVVGIGNIYANEALFLAKILPFREAGSLSFTEIEQLTNETVNVIKNAIKQGGTTLKDFIQPNGNKGYFAQNLFVYQRKNLPCFFCETLIQSKTISQRNTFYCTKCQQ